MLKIRTLTFILWNFSLRSTAVRHGWNSYEQRICVQEFPNLSTPAIRFSSSVWLYGTLPRRAFDGVENFDPETEVLSWPLSQSATSSGEEIICTHNNIHSFSHSDHFYGASSSPLLLRSAPDTARILCRSSHRSATGNCGLRTCPRSLRGG